MEGKRAFPFGAGRTLAFHGSNQMDNNAPALARVPLIPVNHRKPITKRSARGRFGRANFRNKRRPPRNCESYPYPSAHDGLHLCGLLDGNQIFLYDYADYRFLRLHRGCFGEFIKQSSRGSDRRSTSGGEDGDEEAEEDFPPPPDAQPVAALNLYEAYFLAVKCDCLEIWDGSTDNAVLIDKHNLMALFTDIDATFPQFFAVYYHYRMLKYVVISGVKFGVDMALYQYGPSKTHSVYLVYVIIPGVRDPTIMMLDTLQRIANATKKDGLLVQVTFDHLSEEQMCQMHSFEQMKITEVLVRRRERLFDQPVESVPVEMLPAYMQQQMVDEGKLPPSFAPRVAGAFQPRYPMTNSPRPFFTPRQSGGFPERFPRPQSSFSRRGPPQAGPMSTQSSQQSGEEMVRPPRIRPNAFHMPTVSFGVRRVFRGRSFGVTRGRGAERGGLITGQPPVYRPVFRGLGSWSNRRGDFRVNRPGFGNTYVENVSTTPSGLFDNDDQEEATNDNNEK